MGVKMLIAILQVLLLWSLEHRYLVFYQIHPEKEKEEVKILQKKLLHVLLLVIQQINFMIII
jgi:hypothetical protein